MSKPDPALWHALLERLSTISEEAFAAGWMTDVEFEVWSMLQGGKTEYGHTVVRPDVLAQLSILTDALNGWAAFGEDGEEFVPRAEWERRYATWLATAARRRTVGC